MPALLLLLGMAAALAWLPRWLLGLLALALALRCAMAARESWEVWCGPAQHARAERQMQVMLVGGLQAVGAILFAMIGLMALVRAIG